MTPLAARLAKQLTVPTKHRGELGEFYKLNDAHLRNALGELHCFEATEILPMIYELNKSLVARFGEMTFEDKERPPELADVFSTFTFLPAPKTWIEFLFQPCWRMALLVEEKPKNRWAEATLLTDRVATPLGHVSLHGDDIHCSGGQVPVDDRLIKWWCDYRGQSGPDFFKHMLSQIHSLLIIINSPKIIGRKQVMPHRGLERRLTQTFGAGKFPLRAWTELKLHVAKPIDIDDGEPHEAHLTGQRALHFVRKHIRIRLGRLEYVSAHWRGDAAIGIKQTRYKLVH